MNDPYAAFSDIVAPAQPQPGVQPPPASAQSTAPDQYAAFSDIVPARGASAPQDPNVRTYRAPDGSLVPIQAGTSQTNVQAIMAGQHGQAGGGGSYTDTTATPQQATTPANPFYDAIQSIPTGVLHGVIGDTIGMPGNLRDMAGWAAEGVSNTIGRLAGGDGHTFDGMARRLSGAGLPNAFSLPDEGDIVDGTQAMTDARFHTPTTMAGRGAMIAGEFVPGVAMPGTLPARIVTPTLQAGATFGASEGVRAAGHPELEPYADLAAAMLAGHVANMPLGASGADKLVASSTADVDDARMAQILARRQAGERVGVPVSLGEAHAAVTDSPSLVQVQRAVEQSPAGSKIIAPVIANRARAARDALGRVADQIAPADQAPGVLGLRNQEGAQAAVAAATKARTEAVNPSYTAAGPQTVNPDAMRGLISDLDAHIASDKTGVLAGPLQRFRSQLVDQPATEAAEAQAASPRNQLERAWAEATGQPVPEAPPSGPVPILDIENLDRLRKYTRDNTQASLDRGRITPEQGAVLGSYADRLDGLMEDASDPYVQGKQTYADLSRSSVEPLTAGPVGAIAATPDLATQTSALFPSKPFEGAPAQTTAAAGALNEASPGLVAGLLRQYVTREGAAAMPEMKSGDNPFAPATFAQRMTGNGIAAQNLRAGMESSASPQAADQFQDLVDAMMTTGRRLPATAPENAQAAALLQPGHMDPSEGIVTGGVAAEALHSPLGLGAGLAAKGIAGGINWANQLRARMAARDLAGRMFGPADATASTIYDARTARQREDENMARLLMGSYAGFDQPR